ncbi:MAG: hypothetical protein WCT05_02410 [Lentisphaeria bacterium]
MIPFASDSYAFGLQRIALCDYDVQADYLALREMIDRQFACANLSRSDYLRNYLRLLERYAQEWLVEYHAMASGLQIEANELIMTLAARHAPPAIACTSWIIMPDVSRGHRILLHKNRDGGDSHQAWIIRSAPGRFRWAGLVDSLGASPLFGINEHGLAGAMNSGEFCRENTHVGLHTPDMLRLALEQTANAKDALALCREIVLRGHYSHGEYGSTFLFADSEHAFIMENTAAHVVSAEVLFGLDVRSNSWHLPGLHGYALPAKNKELQSNINRRMKILRGLQKKAPAITVAHCRLLARTTTRLGLLPGDAVCRKPTSFGITTELNGRDSVVSLLAGPPDSTIAIPFSIRTTAVPECLAKSLLFRTAFALRNAGIRPQHPEKLEKHLDHCLASIPANADAEKFNCSFDSAANTILSELQKTIQQTEQGDH